MHTKENKKNNKTINAAKHKRRTKLLFAAECVVFVLLLMVIFFLYQLNKLKIKELDSDKLVTNPVERTTEATTSQTIIESENTLDISIPTTFEEETTEESEEESEEESTSPKYKAPFGDEGYTTLVLFGVDTRKSGSSYLEGTNSDVIILVSINNNTGGIRMCSVYRDTYMKLYGMDKYGKANLGYCSYDIYEAINTLNMNLDLNITEYISVDWTAAIKVIDVLGGALIKLDPKFYEIPYAQSSTGKVPYFNGLISELVSSTGIDSPAIPQEYFDGREYLANGVQSVAYMRLRYTDSDLYRTQRQRAVINQMLDKAKNSDLKTLLKVYDVASEYVELSLTETEILGLIYNVLKYKIEDTHGYPFVLYSGEDYSGGMKYNIITVNMVDNVKKLHKFLYDDEDYQPTNTIYDLDKELRKIANFNDEWKPNFDTKYYFAVDTDSVK